MWNNRETVDKVGWAYTKSFSTAVVICLKGKRDVQEKEFLSNSPIVNIIFFF